MASSLIAACLWVIAATLTALLPMRFQIAPGLLLLVLALPLLVWIAYEVGPWMVIAALLAVISLFRRPLRVLIRKVRQG